MSYSSTAIANLSLEQIQRQLTDDFDPNRLPVNYWQHKGRQYFAENGQENEDGRITGTIWRDHSTLKGHCERAGGYHIAADGRILLFPTTIRTQRTAAEAIALAEFLRIYGQSQAIHDCAETLGK